MQSHSVHLPYIPTHALTIHSHSVHLPYIPTPCTLIPTPCCLHTFPLCAVFIHSLSIHSHSVLSPYIPTPCTLHTFLLNTLSEKLHVQCFVYNINCTLHCNQNNIVLCCNCALGVHYFTDVYMYVQCGCTYVRGHAHLYLRSTTVALKFCSRAMWRSDQLREP